MAREELLTSTSLPIQLLAAIGLFKVEQKLSERGMNLVALIRELTCQLAGRHGMIWDVANQVVSIHNATLPFSLLRQLSKEELYEVLHPLK